MAESPAHRFGQVIGGLLESVVRPQLESFCEKQGLYLDHQSKARPARSGKKVSWTDQYGNTHDLDFVIERNGADDKIGAPLAFIESAWRRYTKHSRNKAQEIQGAIRPLAEKYRWNNPFLGTILAGVFTEGSLGQLRSLGFSVLYFPYESLVAAFRSQGIHIAFDEKTPDRVFRQTTDRIVNASPKTMSRIRARLVKINQEPIGAFFDALNKRLGRHVTRVVVIPLYGKPNEFSMIEDAVKFLDRYRVSDGSGDFRKYEIRVDFSNGDKVGGVPGGKTEGQGVPCICGHAVGTPPPRQALRELITGSGHGDADWNAERIDWLNGAHCSAWPRDASRDKTPLLPTRVESLTVLIHRPRLY